MADDEDGSLMFRFHRVFFREFLAGYREDLLTNSTRTHDVVPEKTLGLIHRIDKLIHDAEYASVMISDNEDIESAATSSILFCVLPYVKGYLLYNHTAYDLNTRAGILSDALSAWRIFGKYCDQIGIFESDKGEESREAIISARKRQALLKESFLRVEAATNIDDVRESVVDLIEYMMIEWKRNQKLAVQELELLKVRDQSTRSMETTDRNAPPRKPWTMRIDSTNLRATFASQVFRPDIAMPTMTLEEFAQLEMSRVLSNRSPIRTPAVEDLENIYRNDATEEEAEDDKKRAWDDWKDDNLRGSGNKLVNLG